MSIIIATVVTWIAITIFFLVPKKLTLFEAIFVFCADTIFELSIFSIFHVNLKWIEVEPRISNGIADLMFRLVELPLLLVATSNILLLEINKAMKWVSVAAIILFTLLVQKVLTAIHLITFQHWNIVYSFLFMCASVAFSRWMTWVITSLDKKETA